MVITAQPSCQDRHAVITQCEESPLRYWVGVLLLSHKTNSHFHVTNSYFNKTNSHFVISLTQLIATFTILIAISTILITTYEQKYLICGYYFWN